MIYIQIAIEFLTGLITTLAEHPILLGWILIGYLKRKI